MLSSLALPAFLWAGSAAAGTSMFGSRDLLVTDGVRCACTQLSGAASDSTLFPNSTAYETQRINVWDKRSNLNPVCIYMPSNADDVAKAVEIFHTCNAPFAVKGGGHMTVSTSKTTSNARHSLIKRGCSVPGGEHHQRRSPPGLE